MDTGTIQGIGTVLAMLAFCSICVWAWSSKKKADFDEAAQLPLIEDRDSQYTEPPGQADIESEDGEKKR